MGHMVVEKILARASGNSESKCFEIFIDHMVSVATAAEEQLHIQTRSFDAIVDVQSRLLPGAKSPEQKAG